MTMLDKYLERTEMEVLETRNALLIVEEDLYYVEDLLSQYNNEEVEEFCSLIDYLSYFAS